MVYVSSFKDRYSISEYKFGEHDDKLINHPILGQPIIFRQTHLVAFYDLLCVFSTLLAL